MNDIDDDAADELTQRYRLASASDPSRPSQQVRETIAAQARKAMTLRSARAADEAALAQMEVLPAANDSRWRLRAVAGLAGVGLAGLLALQLMRTTPRPELPRATVAAQPMSTEPTPAPQVERPATVAERDVADRRASLASTATANLARRGGGATSQPGTGPSAFPGSPIGSPERNPSPPQSTGAASGAISEVPLTVMKQEQRGGAGSLSTPVTSGAAPGASRSRVAPAAAEKRADAAELVMPPPQLPAQSQKYYDAAWAEVRSRFPQVITDPSGRYHVISVLLTADAQVRSSRLQSFDASKAEAAPQPDFSVFADSGVRADDLDLSATFSSTTVQSKTIDIATRPLASASPVRVFGFVLRADADGPHSSSRVNAVVRAHFSGGLPISRPQVNVALFTVFMSDSGDIDRSRLEYVTGQGISRLSESAATVERFASLGVPRDRIGQMGTTLITDEVNVDDSRAPSSEVVAARIEELEKLRQQLLLRYTPQHPQVAALDSTLQQLRAATSEDGRVCCRLVIVAYAWPRAKSDSASLPVQRAMENPGTVNRAMLSAIAARYFAGAEFETNPGTVRAWVLLDNQGKVLHTGSYDFQTSDQIAAYLRSTYPGIRISNTLMTDGESKDGGGKILPMALLWLAADSPLPQ